MNYNYNLYSVSLVKEKTFKTQEPLIITNAEQVYDICIQKLHLDKRAEEYCYLFALAPDNSLIGISEISHGSLSASIVEPREVFKRAILFNAANIIIVHNHPSGNVEPSPEDIKVANRLEEAGELLGIELLDFIIVGDDYYSFMCC